MTGSIFQAATEVSIGERDGQVIVTFLRSGDLSSAVNITYDVTSESATPGADFTGGSGTVLMAAGASSTTVTFPIINDTLSEATETFIVSLAAVDSGEISLPRTVRVNILDDENPVVPPASPPLVSDYRVIKEPLVSDLNQPIKFEFSPVDPDLAYVADKTGVISLVNFVTGAEVGTVLDIRGLVNENNDRGLYDIAFHPDFENNPYMYTFYVVEPPDATPEMQDAIGNRYAYVVRYTLDASQNYQEIVPGSEVILLGGAGQSTADISGGGTLNFSSPAYSNLPSSERYLDPAGGDIVIDGIKQDYIKVDSVSHVGGSLAFGPDGMLYISVGDGGSPNYADPHNADVQNLNSTSGKILRVDPLTGDGLTDNPFYQTGMSLDSNSAKVYQLGLRNPFSMGFDSLGRLIISDTGWNAYEEIDIGPAGTNFGWPWYEGRDGGVLAKTSGYQSLPPAASFYAAVESGAIQVAAPHNAFGHAESAPGFQNQVITGGDVIYTGGRYPVEFLGDYFFTDFFNGSTFVIDTNNRLDVKFLFPSEGQYAPVHFIQGTDGYVYYTELFGPDFSAGSMGRVHIFNEDDNLLVNGSFEQPIVPVGSSNFGTVPGWTAITGGRIEIWKAHNSVVASDGANFLELDYVAGQDGFFQDVQTEAGKSYTLAFDLRTRLPTQPTSTQSVEVLWNGVVVDTFTPDSVNWDSVVVPLIGTGGMDRLTIREVASQGADGFGAMLDHFGLYSAGAPVPPPPPPPTNLLVNGSFEQPTVPVGGSLNFNSVTGWTAITGGRIEIWNAHNGVTASNGANFLELDYVSARDGFSQSVQTIDGATYELSFDLRTRLPSRPTSTQGVEVVWNGVVIDTVAPTSATWTTRTFDVVGTGGLDTLTIREVASQGTDGWGAMLDDFSLIAANLPPLDIHPLHDQEAQVGEAFSFVVPIGTFSDPDGDPLTFSVTLVGGGALPGWLNFNPGTRTFSGTPPATGSLQVQVTASDGTASTSDVFNLDIARDLLVNGSFEQPVIPVGSANFSSVPGWTAMSGGQIEIWKAHNGVVASSGVNFLELDYLSATDGLSQSVQTVAGQTYELSFDLRTRLPVQPSTTQGVEVVWNGVLVNTVTPASETWTTVTLDVVGTGGLDTLTIREVASQGGDGRGAMLDDVSLIASGPTSPPPPANLFVNGSFEQPTVAVGGSANFDAVTGWTAITGGKIEIWNAHNGVTASNGANFLELDYVSARDGFSQSVQTAAGQSYELSFDLRTRLPDRPTTTQGVEVVWNGVLIDTVTPASASWTTVTYDVVGTGALDTLTIREVASQGGDGWGAMLDDFSLIASGAPPNGAPIVADPLDDRGGQVGEAFSFVVPPDAFTDPDGDPLTYSATLVGGGALPAWLSFDPATRTFSGTPPETGTFQVQVVANDGEAWVMDAFNLDIRPTGVELLVNGSFEQPVVPVGGSSNFDAVAGWTAITGGKIEIWNAHNGVVAKDGVNFLELDYVSARDGFSQTVQTVSGETYELSFDIRTRLPARATTTQGVEVVWNGVLVNTITPASANWTTVTLDVVGTGSLDTLTIREVASQGSDGWGAMLDNFSLTGAAPNLLVNGSFESPVMSAAGFAAFDSVTGWTAIPGGKIEIWNAHNGVTASDGANFLELDYASAPDGFSQNVQTEAGQTYELSFDLRTRLPSHPTTTQSVEVVWNGVLIDTVTPASASWTTLTFDVVGTGGVDILTIREVASQATDGWGAMLDNFSLTATAPPNAAASAVALEDSSTSPAVVANERGSVTTHGAHHISFEGRHHSVWDADAWRAGPDAADGERYHDHGRHSGDDPVPTPHHAALNLVKLLGMHLHVDDHALI